MDQIAEFEISLAASVNANSTLDFQLTVVVRRGVGAASEVSETNRSFKRGYSDVAMAIVSEVGIPVALGHRVWRAAPHSALILADTSHHSRLHRSQASLSAVFDERGSRSIAFEELLFSAPWGM